MNVSVPSSPPTEGSPLPFGAKACKSRFFCRFPFMSRQSYLPLSIVQAFGCRFQLAICSSAFSALECLTSLADGLTYYALC